MNIERDYPICLKGLTDVGIGKRKAKRMIRRAVHQMHKDGDKWSIWDKRPDEFCYHHKQGNYCEDWQIALFY